MPSRETYIKGMNFEHLGLNKEICLFDDCMTIDQTDDESTKPIEIYGDMAALEIMYGNAIESCEDWVMENMNLGPQYGDPDWDEQELIEWERRQEF